MIELKSIESIGFRSVALMDCERGLLQQRNTSARPLYGDHKHLHMDPSGIFIIEKLQGDAGLYGRKSISNTRGGWGCVVMVNVRNSADPLLASAAR